MNLTILKSIGIVLLFLFMQVFFGGIVGLVGVKPTNPYFGLAISFVNLFAFILVFAFLRGRYENTTQHLFVEKGITAGRVFGYAGLAFLVAIVNLNIAGGVQLLFLKLTTKAQQAEETQSKPNVADQITKKVDSFNKKVMETLTNIATGPALLTLLLFVLVAPITEEILFRGIILRGLLEDYRPGTALVASSLLFAFMHVNFIQLLPTLILGAVCGAIYLKRRSIWLCIYFHMIYNFYCILPSMLMKSA